MRCALEQHSDFPCEGLVRTEWWDADLVGVCEGHRRRIINDLRDVADEHDDGSRAMWNAR